MYNFKSFTATHSASLTLCVWLEKRFHFKVCFEVRLSSKLTRLFPSRDIYLFLKSNVTTTPIRDWNLSPSKIFYISIRRYKYMSLFFQGLYRVGGQKMKLTFNWQPGGVTNSIFHKNLEQFCFRNLLTYCLA